MIKRTSKSGQSNKSGRPKRLQGPGTEGVREFVRRPVVLVVLTMTYSYLMLVWAPVKLSQQQTVNVTASTLLVAGVGLSLLMYRRARSASRGDSDRTGFGEFFGSIIALVVFAAGAVYTYVYGYTGFEVLHLAAACLAITFVARLSKAQVKVSSPRRASRPESADRATDDFRSGASSSLEDMMSDESKSAYAGG